MSTQQSTDDGAPSWIDAAGFAAGLFLAWQRGWKTTDLVWSLWLSSLVVGYALIVWIIAGPVVVKLPAIWRDRALMAESPGRSTAGILILGIGAVLMLAFFTFHFGGFHFGHSVFLALFFPLVPEDGFPAWRTYGEVVSRYWMWLPVAFLAERAGFSQAVRARPAPTPADTAVTPEAIAARKRRTLVAPDVMTLPYKNVIRMHLLIFFFAGAHFAKLENFAVYAVVYAVYFFPWRWLGGKLRQSRLARS